MTSAGYVKGWNLPEDDPTVQGDPDQVAGVRALVGRYADVDEVHDQELHRREERRCRSVVADGIVRGGARQMLMAVLLGQVVDVDADAGEVQRERIGGGLQRSATMKRNCADRGARWR